MYILYYNIIHTFLFWSIGKKDTSNHLVDEDEDDEDIGLKSPPQKKKKICKTAGKIFIILFL